MLEMSFGKTSHDSESSQLKSTETQMLVNDETTIDESLSNFLPIKDYFNARFSICLPSTCNNRDILQTIRTVTSLADFTITENIDCQTQTELDTRHQRLTIAQKLSL